MSNARGKTVDTTYLSIDNATERGFIHRDYIAHCLRWSHVIKQLYAKGAYKTARILDIGCGRELPLAKTLYSSRLIVEKYVGVDFGPIEAAAFHTGKFPIKLFPNTDFLKFEEMVSGDEAIFTHLTCFEMLEHVEPQHCQRLLRAMHRIMKGTDAVLYMSTPIWDGMNVAANHVNEMKYHALGWMLEELGFHIVDVHGTFASQKDYVHKLSPAHRETFNDLSEYYDSNLLSCIFAPFYPEHSRNAMWVLKAAPESNHRLFTREMFDACKPWGSSAKWEEMEVVYA